ncbi:hypothetical protein [Candidatus Palauibacter sp.]|uniref:hypothetical protein n=1 Tax=Candidatus Palauibacter sp. TaxID=3101350 RepID=UPI003AF1E842
MRDREPGRAPRGSEAAEFRRRDEVAKERGITHSWIGQLVPRLAEILKDRAS